MRQRRSTQEHPPDLPPIMPPDLIDLQRPLDVPDEARMQVAIHRAYRYHLQRILDTEGIDYTTDRGELSIITLPSAFPAEAAPGWWRIGIIADHHDGLALSLNVFWQPRTDRVKLERPPIPPPLPTHEERPIKVDCNYRVHVAEGWRYWYKGQEYTAEEARAALSGHGRETVQAWTWERIDGPS